MTGKGLLVAAISALCLAAPASAAIQVDQVDDINPSGSSNPDELAPFGDNLIFQANDGTTGIEPWITDGTGADLVADMNPTGDSNAANFAALGNVVLFGGFATANPGFELYKTNGSGVTLVADIYPSGGSNPNYLTRLGNNMIFDAVESGLGHTLHVSDGGSAQLLKSSDGGAVGDANPVPSFKKLGQSLLFRGFTTTDGNALWKTDGTDGGTRIVKKVNPTVDPFGKLGSELFFAAGTEDDGIELWKTDGSPGGTRVVKDIQPGEGDSYPSFGYDFGKAGRNLLFRAVTNKGSELWRTDGTPQGTKLVKDIYEGPSGSNPRGMTTLGKDVIFTASDNLHGAQLFISDGTEKGTKALKQISTNPDYDGKYHRLGDTVFLAGNGSLEGNELWGTDGTKSGTQLVEDINPSGSSTPINFAKAGDALYFAATGPDGNELYRVTGG